MTIWEELVWGAPQWVTLASLVGSVLAILVVWNYASGGGSRTPLRWTAAGLKLLAIGLLAICLLQPMRSGVRARPQANLFAIAVDNSQSMALRATPSSPSRADRIRRLVDPESAWRVRLAQDFDVRSYSIDSRLENVDSLPSLAMDGWASALATGMDQIATRFRDRPVAGLLLFSDGNLTDASAAPSDWSELGFPVYPVVTSRDETLVDLRIAAVGVTRSDFETAPVTVRVTIADDGMPSEDVVVQLSDAESGTVVGEQTAQTPPADVAGREWVVTFRIRPLGSGVRFYRAAVFRPADRDRWDSVEATGEVTFRNNSRLIAVDPPRGPYRVLYLAGRPNWDFKHLRRALQEDSETDLVGLLRIADKEAKFSFRDREVSSSNPLFAGLEESEEETAQRYDEAVLIRLGVRDADELVRGFPRTEEELFPYHAVILDDIEAEFFSQDQLLLLRQFVAARGGGLLFLGGQESFVGKRFAQSPLGELSPLYPAGRVRPTSAGGRDQTIDLGIGDQWGRTGSAGLSLELTREGMVQPWVRLRETEQAERERIDGMPSFATRSPVGGAKPGASVLAVVRDRDGQVTPGIVAQRFGKGRTAAVPLGDLWRWSMRRDAVTGSPPSGNRLSVRDDSGEPNAATVRRDDPAQAWRQITRWLVNESPRQVECRVVVDDDPSEPARLLTTVVDETFTPVENATVSLEITPPTGEPFPLVAVADFDSPGSYVASHWARDAGGYRVAATAVAEDGSEIGTATTAWTADPAAAEFRELSLNRRWLDEVAAASGGEVVEASNLDAFVADLPTRKVPITESWVYPIWHRPWVMLLAIACLCGEWGLRRWKGMP